MSEALTWSWADRPTVAFSRAPAVSSAGEEILTDSPALAASDDRAASPTCSEAAAESEAARAGNTATTRVCEDTFTAVVAVAE